jgi:hypothetical protein
MGMWRGQIMGMGRGQIRQIMGKGKGLLWGLLFAVGDPLFSASAWWQARNPLHLCVMNSKMHVLAVKTA